MFKFTGLVLALILAVAPFVSAQNASIAYTPYVGKCPDGFSLVRNASKSPKTPQLLSQAEYDYISARQREVLPKAWKSYLDNVKAAGFSLPDYVSAILGDSDTSSKPTLGIALSGGGYRSAIFGAGVLNMLDGRNSTSVETGTGGLLQSASYIAGLSGGAWLVTSLAQADFPIMNDLIFGSVDLSGWLAQFDILAPNSDPQKDMAFAVDLIMEVKGKHDAGFPVGIADLYSRSLSRHFVTGTTVDNFFDPAALHGAGVTFSGIADLPTFLSYSQPFPILVSDLSSPNGDPSKIVSGGGNDIPLTNPIFEFNVYETGSFDPNLAAFIPTKYLGTSNTSECVTGFEQAAYMAGTSANIFILFNTSADALLNSLVGPVIQLLDLLIPQPGVELVVAQIPNPFRSPDVGGGAFIDNQETNLGLVDGGQDGQGLPLQPLLVKARDVDVIIGIDGSGDDSTNNFPDGSALTISQNRTTFFPSAYSFPPVPNSASSFAPLLNHPTFFGCSSKPPTPLIIYIPNSAPRSGAAPLTNTSFLQLAYPPEEIRAMLGQIFDIATQGFPVDGGDDKEWPACLACAVVDRSRAKLGRKRSGICKTCFERYCWDGK